MPAVLLDGLRMTNTTQSYIDAMHAILSHRGWITCSKYMLTGMTVAGFRFTVQRSLQAESTTAYNWMAENFIAADFIGIAASQGAGINFESTFPLYQKQAVGMIKESIDNGIGVVVWKDRFVVVAGYDDDKQVLYYSDGEGDEQGIHDGLKSLAYLDFGRNETPYWYYQYFENKIELDEIEIYRESLIQAIYKWETHDPMLPEGEYACGRFAYDAIISVIQTGDYIANDGASVIGYYAGAKRDISLYIRELSQMWPEIVQAAEEYSRVAAIFAEVACLLVEWRPEISDIALDSQPQVTLLVALVQEAKEREANAIEKLRWWMRESLDNRFHDIGLR